MLGGSELSGKPKATRVQLVRTLVKTSRLLSPVALIQDPFSVRRLKRREPTKIRATYSMENC